MEAENQIRGILFLLLILLVIAIVMIMILKTRERPAYRRNKQEVVLLDKTIEQPKEIPAQDQKQVQRREWSSDRDIVAWLRHMTPTQFEIYISSIFIKLGYEARSVGRSHDGGIDVIATKDGVDHYIQCKKFITSQVGVAAVRDFYGAMADKLAVGQGYFITTNKFTLEAREFAHDKPIELVDSFKLIKYIRMAYGKSGEMLPAIRRLEHEEFKKCPSCSGKLVIRSGKYGKFWGCENYPRCKFHKKFTVYSKL